MFVEANAVGIILMVNVGRIQDKFPFFEDCMRDDLFELYFLFVFEEEGLGVEEHVFVAVDDEIM